MCPLTLLQVFVFLNKIFHRQLFGHDDDEDERVKEKEEKSKSLTSVAYL